MGDGLAGGGAVVDADVVGIGGEVFVKVLFYVVHGLGEGGFLLRVGVKVAGNVALGDDEGVAGGYGEVVADGEAVLVGIDDSL